MYIPSALKILLLLAASTAATLADKVGGYNATCGEVRLDDNGNPQDLTGDCDNESTQFTRKTRLDLNLCYSVDALGHMVPTNAGTGLNTSRTGKPCEKCFLGNGHELPWTYYACDCLSSETHIVTHSSVYLSDLISNVDGYLTCFNNTGKFLSEWINW
ncbi:hypothetical protein F4774DRAFT_411425 [Daldinia eschscholtzii]|nr:hypothetical protein F4774DRAFT_411425 [Daldinia eschscholtzii]